MPMSESLAHWQPWRMEPLGTDAPAVDPADIARRELQRRRAAEQRLELQRQREQALDEARQQGHAEGRQLGYDNGLAEGREAAAQELRQQVKQTLEPLRALCLSFDAALREVDGLLAVQVGKVALELAGRLAGEALAVQPAQVEAQVRQMLASDPELAGKPRLSLNRQQGHAEGRQLGYDNGLAEGREAAAQELRQQVKQTLEPLRALCLSFDAALREVDGLLAVQVGKVALELAGRLAGEALAVQPAQVEAQVRQMLASDPELAGKPRLSLNPDDLPWVESSLGEELHAAGWSLHADPSLLPGGCRVSSKAGELDATRQTRQALFEGNGQWLLEQTAATPDPAP